MIDTSQSNYFGSLHYKFNQNSLTQKSLSNYQNHKNWTSAILDAEEVLQNGTEADESCGK